MKVQLAPYNSHVLENGSSYLKECLNRNIFISLSSTSRITTDTVTHRKLTVVLQYSA